MTTEPDEDLKFITRDGDVGVWIGKEQPTGVEHYGAVEYAFEPYLFLSPAQIDRMKELANALPPA